MRYAVLFLALAGCSQITTPAPNIYPNSCPMWDKDCERRFDARTLSLIGQDDAAMELMCLDKGLEEALAQCGDQFSSIY